MADDKAIDWGAFEVAGSPTSAAASHAAAPPPADAGAAPHQQTPAPAAARETVVVHCPNGHRLVVPASHVGRMGKCAKCQTAFRIPAAGEAKAATATPSAPQHAETAAPAEAAAVKPADVGHGGPAGGPIAAAPPAPAAHDGADATPVAPEPRPAVLDLPAATSSIAGLLTRLWDEVERGGVVELHIEGGCVILPKWFERRLSGGTHALFASQAVDGTVTLTAVAWDSIQRIVIRNVGDLPDGMFD